MKGSPVQVRASALSLPHLCGRPLADFLHKRHRGVAIQWLAVKQILVAEGNRVLGEGDKPIHVQGHRLVSKSDHFNEPIEVVRAIVLLATARDYGLQPLLNRLLSVKADDAIP